MIRVYSNEKLEDYSVQGLISLLEATMDLEAEVYFDIPIEIKSILHYRRNDKTFVKIKTKGI